MAAPSINLDGVWGARLLPQNFEMRSGDDRTLSVTIRDRTGATVSLTGTYVWVLTNSDSPQDSVKVTKSGSVTAGVATVTIDDTDTDDLDGVYFHEMTVAETSSAAESVVMNGHVRIGPDQG